jgi:glycosyltransferase involved in cell wall biosynthesis
MATQADLPKVSVIIPVYNVEPYLRRCLDSVVNQSLRDIEIICINDASPDNSISILLEYAAKDTRIKVIDFEQNQGTAVARNAAMAVAQGEYIGFVDSDDYVDLDFYEKLYALAVESGADIVKGDTIITDYNGKASRFSINDKVGIHKAHFYGQFWTAIYKTTLIRHNTLTFPKGIINGQDLVFLSQAVFFANTVLTTDAAVYHHIKREGSVDQPKLSRERIFNILTAIELIFDFINSVDSKDKGYDIVFVNILNNLTVYLSVHNRESDVLSTVAEKAVTMYRRCKRKQQFLSTGRCVGKKFIINKDVAGLVGFFRKYDSRVKLLAAELREHVNGDTLENTRGTIYMRALMTAPNNKFTNDL